LTELANGLLLKLELEGELREGQKLDQLLLGANVVELDPTPLGSTLEVEQRHCRIVHGAVRLPDPERIRFSRGKEQ
jgi:hypothetical protein